MVSDGSKNERLKEQEKDRDFEWNTSVPELPEDFSRAYKEAVAGDLPDLWDKIESQLTEKTAGVPVAATEDKAVKMELAEEGEGGENKKEKIKQFPRRRYGVIIAACICGLCVIPVIVFRLLPHRMNFDTAQNESAAATMDFSADDSEEEMTEDCIEEIAEDYSEEIAVEMQAGGTGEFEEEEAAESYEEDSAVDYAEDVEDEDAYPTVDSAADRDQAAVSGAEEELAEPERNSPSSIVYDQSLTVSGVSVQILDVTDLENGEVLYRAKLENDMIYAGTDDRKQMPKDSIIWIYSGNRLIDELERQVSAYVSLTVDENCKLDLYPVTVSSLSERQGTEFYLIQAD